MALNLVTGPQLEPVSLDEAKSHCQITSTADDGILIGYIMAARQHVESVTGRSLITQTWDLAIDRNWPVYFDRKYGGERRLIELPRSPVQSVTSVTYVDQNGVTQTLDPSQYRVYGLHTAGQATGSIPGIARIEQAIGVYWPLLYPQGAVITVRFVAGYGDSPGSIHEGLRQAMLLLIRLWYDNRGEAMETDHGIVPLGFEALVSQQRVWYGQETHFMPMTGRLWV
jgi:uncharacterized phiE125 gp8 family phage protein